MRSVVDEAVPRKVVKTLRELGHDVHSFPKEWKGTKNGHLLTLVAENGFGCLITSDKNLTRQQNIARAGLAVVVLPNQTLEELELLKEQIGLLLASIRPGEVRHVTRNAAGPI